MGYVIEIGSKFDILKRVANNLGYEFEMDRDGENFVYTFYPQESTKALGVEYRVLQSEDTEAVLAKVFAEFIMTKEDA